MHDQFDVTLEDADLLGEVELTTNLIIAASESDDHLSGGADRRDPGRRTRAPRIRLTGPSAIPDSHTLGGYD